MASVTLYCLCGKPYDSTKFMIQCDACKDWFHGNCVGLYEHQSSDIEKYHCPKCEKMFGPSISKQRTNWHRHNYVEEDADNKAVQTGTPVFMKELKSRHFPNADEVLLVMRGQQLTLPFLVQSGFDKPILVENKDGLGLVVPPPGFSLEDVEQYLGSDLEIDAIDVARQEDLRMTLNDFVYYFNSPTRQKVFNVISLEFSNTRMSPLVEPPYVVNKLSWIHNLWPKILPEGCPVTKPNVNKYCLVGVRDSYTDFHIDFGGTSVWYHIMKGEKVFFLIRPTPANLALYKRWMASSTRSETFFGDQVDACYRFVLRQGNTLLIPTGWIHAVFTPVDSLVFGGNFLHSLNIPIQLQVYDIERRIKTPEKYSFPWFETCNWFAAKHLLQELKDQGANGGKVLPYVLEGSKALLSALKSWTHDKEHLKLHKDEIPSTIQYTKLIKELAKEVRHAEKVPLNKKGKLRQLPPRDKRGRRCMKFQMQSEEVRVQVPTKAASLKSNHRSALSDGGANSNSLVSRKVSHSKQKLKVHTSKSEIKRDKTTLHARKTKGVGNPLDAQTGFSPAILKSNESPLPPQQLKGDDSVYDFCESEDDSLVVDENPSVVAKKPRNHSRKASQAGRKQMPIKLKLSIYGRSASVLEQTFQSDVGGQAYADTHALPPSPKLAGIEELLRASGYAADGSAKAPVAAEHADVKPLGNSRQYEDRMEPIVTVDNMEIAECSDTFAVTQSGRASPSTREAIQGMLSIGQDIQFSSSPVVSPTHKQMKPFSSLLPPDLSHSSEMHPSTIVVTPSSAVHNSNVTTIAMSTTLSTYRIRSDSDVCHDGTTQYSQMDMNVTSGISEEEELLIGCHQDDEFVYPSLDGSDDDGPVFKCRGRDKQDEPWNPKAKLLPNCPKPDRPVREGTKNEAIESGLAAAAARLAHLPVPKRSYRKRKPSLKAKRASSDVESFPGVSTEDQTLFDPMTPFPLQGSRQLKCKKPRRGFATTKQRLGRILKIHKMLY